MWRKGTVLHQWEEGKSVQPLWKPVWKFLKTLKVELPYDPAIIPRHTSGQNCNSKKYMNSYVHSSTIHSIQDMEMI